MPFRKCQTGPRKVYERPPKIGSADDQNDFPMTIIAGILITIPALSTAVAWRRRFRRRHRKQPSREIEGFRTGIVISSEMIPMRWLQNSFRSSTLSNAGV